MDVFPTVVTSWDAFIGSSPHPLAPSLNVIFAEQFTSEERQLFEKVMRPTVEAGQAIAIAWPTSVPQSCPCNNDSTAPRTHGYD
jgi:hypothetical protein